jgi:hypothetical protein
MESQAAARCDELIERHAALGPRPSACQANRTASGRGQGLQPPKAEARLAPALRPADRRPTSQHSCSSMRQDARECLPDLPDGARDFFFTEGLDEATRVEMFARRKIRNFLCRASDRSDRFLRPKKCQPCLRTGVSYVPGLNTALAMTVGLMFVPDNVLESAGDRRRPQRWV